MKIFYTLSAMALFNLTTVVVLANYPISKILNEKVQESETFETLVLPSPTPIVVKRQVVKKVTVFATNAPVTAKTVTTTQNQTQPTQPVTQPAQQPAQQPAPPAPVPSGCIITLDGASYNVTNLQKTHSGGDIFNCGSDMSATFWGKHGQSIFSKMQQYRI